MSDTVHNWYRVEFKLTFKAKNEWDEDRGFKTVTSATHFPYYYDGKKSDINKRLLKECWEQVSKGLDHYIDNEFKLVKVEITEIYKLIYNSKHNVNGFKIECE
mgnify:CR=1 FL=1